MKKDIYKITNLINGKVYIGQTKNIKRRIKEHQQEYASNHVSKIRNAIKKYGIQNCKVEIIEHDIENYDERERYWISFYSSTNTKYGYNIAPGGNSPAIVSGEKSFFAKYSDSFVNKIKSDIIAGLSYKTIEAKYNVNEAYLVLLNAGKVRRSENETYPLRSHGNQRTSIETINRVIDLLENTTDSVARISKILHVSTSTIWDINTGKCYNCPKTINYPIRDDYSKISRKKLKDMINDIKDNKLKFSEIEKKYNVSKVFVNRVNNGKMHKLENETYPLRKSSQRVY